jgi:NAD(P)-dependent dehydrogenase (short-subunit alcohol dehydrogenase family)
MGSPALTGLNVFLWPTRAKACAMFSWPFGPLSAFVRLRPPMMGLSTGQAEAVKRQEIERMPLGRRGHPNDVSRWIISLADPATDWITGQVLAVDGGLGLVS